MAKVEKDFNSSLKQFRLAVSDVAHPCTFSSSELNFHIGKFECIYQSNLLLTIIGVRILVLMTDDVIRMFQLMYMK